MTIDRLNNIDPIRDPKKTTPAGRAERGARGDSIAISSDATEKAELYTAIEVAKASPDVRAERVAELKAKLQDPNYLNQTVIDQTAERILDQFFG